MPRVPTVDGPSVRSAPFNPSGQRSFDVSSNTRQLAQALDTGAEVVDRIALRDDQAKAYEADNAIMTEWSEWQRENEPKYKGSRAGEYLPAAKQWWDDAKGKHTESLTPRAKELIGRTLGSKRLAAINGVGAKAEREQELHVVSQESSTIDNTIRAAIDAGQPDVGVAGVTQVLAGRAKRNNWSAGQLEDAVQKALAPMHQAHIAALAVNDPAKAKAYFDANREAIPINARPQMELILQGEAENAEARTFAASVAALPLEEQMAKASKLSPKVQDKALTIVRNNFAMVREAQRVREENAADSAWQLVGQGKRPTEAVLSQMDGKSRVQLQDYLAEKAKLAAKGVGDGPGMKPIKTDVGTHAMLWDMMVNNEDQFISKDTRIAAYATKLNKEDFEQLMKLQQAKRAERSTAANKAPPGVFTLEKQVHEAVAAANIKDPTEAYAAKNAIQQRIATIAATKKGTELTHAERTAAIDEVLIDRVYLPGFLGRSEARYGTLTKEQQDKATVDIEFSDEKYGTLKKTIKIKDIPADKYRITGEELRAAGIPATAANIARYWYAAERKAGR